jgi:hypothetical protein
MDWPNWSCEHQKTKHYYVVVGFDRKARPSGTRAEQGRRNNRADHCCNRNRTHCKSREICWGLPGRGDSHIDHDMMDQDRELGCFGLAAGGLLFRSGRSPFQRCGRCLDVQQELEKLATCSGLEPSYHPCMCAFDKEGNQIWGFIG